MGEELILKILDVDPVKSLVGIGNILKEGGEWYTKEKETKITIDFGNAVITQIFIKNYDADQVSITLKGSTTAYVYYDKVIWKNNPNWMKTQTVDIENLPQDIFDQMIIEVINNDGKEYKGLKRIRVYGIQDEQLYNQRKKNVKLMKKELKQQQKQQMDSKNQEKSNQKETKQNATKTDESSIKKNNQWGLYTKSNNSQNKEIVFQDHREKLRNIHKTPSPIKEEINQFNQNTKQTPQQSDDIEQRGFNINERNMLRYNFNQIDKQFLELHYELQKSSNVAKDMQLNQANIEINWLQ